jgi:short-subunit dehydrogenase
MVYDGTKFAVVGMMESLALELHRDHPGVTCSVLCPGPVATDLLLTSDKQLVDAGSVDVTSDERVDDLANYLAAGQHPDDVGRFAVDGIRAGRFWLITQPEYTFDIMTPRFEAMRRGALHIPADWVDTRE